ncbi:LeuA family protein [Streptomyces sp. NPDC047065]|uniref:LeuA family protein n=1 Tax=Streptomyces sp. NPDC047065 TaxID=3154606 RepID=UPI00340B8DD1
MSAAVSSDMSRDTPDVWFSWNDMEADADPAAEAHLAYTGLFFDETLRDGLQAPNVTNPGRDQKLRLVDHMVRSGIRAADLGFPGSDPSAARECLDLARHVAAARHPLSVGYAGRTHPADVHAICEIAQQAQLHVEAYVFIGVSPIRQYVEDWDVTTIERTIRAAVRSCVREGVTFVLVLEDTVRCTPEVLGRIYDVAIDTGVSRLCLCDTVGAALPHGTAALIRWTRRYFADRGHRMDLEWHGHNDRGLALANSLKALSLGCARVHGTILGIGERTGNASLDQLVVNRTLDGDEGYDLTALREYAEYATHVLDVSIPQNYPALGADVFKTSAGVHASAILKAHEKGDTLLKDAVYSSVPAALLGREQDVLVDEVSGANNVRYWLTTHGFDSTDDGHVKAILERAKSGRGPLTDAQMRQIIATTP